MNTHIRKSRGRARYPEGGTGTEGIQRPWRGKRDEEGDPELAAEDPRRHKPLNGGAALQVMKAFPASPSEPARRAEQNSAVLGG